MKKLLLRFGLLFVLVFMLFTNMNKRILIDREVYKEGVNQNAVYYLVSRANGLEVADYDFGDIHQMYTFSHGATEQTGVLTDYRFIGESPYNYVYFNCDDESDTSSCEIWRIIGVFDVENENGVIEKRIKIVRGTGDSEPDIRKEWDNKETEDSWAGNTEGRNDWKNSVIKEYLNGEYLNSLSDSSKNKIADTKFYLGSFVRKEMNNQDYYGSAEDFYEAERGKNVFSYENYCLYHSWENVCKNNYCQNNQESAICNVTRKYDWVGTVGLMYPSDVYFTYDKGIENTCYNDPHMCNNNKNTGDPTKSWLYEKNMNTWLISPFGEKSGAVSYYLWYGAFFQSYVTNYPNWVRPTVYLRNDVKIYTGDGSKRHPYCLSEKCLNSTSNSNNIKKGGTVIYNGNEYCVIKDCSGQDDYITLLKKEPLSYNELLTYSEGFEIGKDIYNDAGIISFYNSNYCNNSTSLGCDNNYNNSFVKNIVNKWSINYDDDLKEVNGYKARLITNHELDDMGQVLNRFLGGTEYIYYITKSQYDCLYGEVGYWTMSSSSDSGTGIDIVVPFDNTGMNPNKPVFYKYAVRPVINLKKTALGGSCGELHSNNTKEEIESKDNKSTLVCKGKINYKTEKIKKYSEYDIGDEVEYKGEKYHVIEESGKKDNFLTLLKYKPLTVTELYKYGRDESDHLFINEYTPNIQEPEKVVGEYPDGSGSMAFYTSETCGAEREWFISHYRMNNLLMTGCTNDYKKSDVKKVVDNWSKDVIGNDLVEVDGYKARLINHHDLVDNLNYKISSSATCYSLVSDEYNDFFSVSGYGGFWTMIPYDDTNYNVFANIYSSNVLNYYAVRPVINIDKCAIEGGCNIEEIQVEDGCIEDAIIDTNKNDESFIIEEIVTVANTSKYLSPIIIIVSIILIASGIGIIGYIYYKSR